MVDIIGGGVVGRRRRLVQVVVLVKEYDQCPGKETHIVITGVTGGGYRLMRGGDGILVVVPSKRGRRWRNGLLFST